MLKPKITFVYYVNSTGEEDVKKKSNMKTRSGNNTTGSSPLRREGNGAESRA